jgi:hypothetical protein
MVSQTETFGLNVHMHEGFDCDDVYLKSKNLVEDNGLVVGSILTTNGLSTFESITMPSDLYGEAKITWEVLTRVAICPPLYKLLLQLSIVVLLDLQFLGKGCVLVMFSTCQYACNDIKFFVGFKGVNLEAIQSTL